MLRRLNCLLLGGIFMIATASVAHAYILPAESLMRLLAENRRAVTMRDVTLQLNADLAGHDHQVDERLYFKRPERSRLVQQDDTVLVTVDKEGTMATGEDKVLKVVPGPSPNLLPVLLFPKGKDVEETVGRMVHALQGVGVDTHVVALGRMGDVIAYVVGAHPWEQDKPQVWFDKNSMLPVRTIMVQKEDDKPVTVEMRLLEYGNGPAGNGMPRVFEEYRDGKLARRAEVTGAQFNQDLPETLFEWSTRTHR